MSAGNKSGFSGGPSQPKKPKNDEEDDVPESFEDHLAGMDDEEEAQATSLPKDDNF